MKVVHKYQLTPDAFQSVEMPRDAQILDVQLQNDVLQLWALVDLGERITRIRFIRIAGTGHPMHQPIIKYISTFQMARGQLVFHVFEVE